MKKKLLLFLTCCLATISILILSACEDSQKSSEGLEYSLNSDGTYSVSSIGTCTDIDLVIPSKYDGKPVTSIGWYLGNTAKVILDLGV